MATKELIEKARDFVEKEIFTNGHGDKASHLKLFLDNCYLGGWAVQPITDRVQAFAEQYATERLAAYKIALADAIRSPMGTVPDSAQGLVSQKDIEDAEERRGRI